MNPIDSPKPLVAGKGLNSKLMNELVRHGLAKITVGGQILYFDKTWVKCQDGVWHAQQATPTKQ